MRRDLPLGDICAQIIHAVGETIEVPHPPQTIAVALGVKDSDELLEYHKRLNRAGIKHKLIAECDGELMGIGCVPTQDRAKIRKVVSSLPLIK